MPTETAPAPGSVTSTFLTAEQLEQLANQHVSQPSTTERTSDEDLDAAFETGAKNEEPDERTEAEVQPDTDEPKPVDDKPDDKPEKTPKDKPKVEPDPDNPDLPAPVDDEDRKKVLAEKYDIPSDSDYEKAQELRHAFRRTKDRLIDLYSEREEFEAKLSELEPYRQKAEQLASRVAELEEEVTKTNFKQSEEFRNQYEEPYNKAAREAQNALQYLAVQTDDGESRPATSADFEQILQMDPQAPTRRERAQELFGAHAPIVLQHADRLRELWTQRSQGEETLKERAQRWRKEREQKQVEQQKAFFQAYANHQTELVKKYRGYFQPPANATKEEREAYERSSLYVGRWENSDGSLTPENAKLAAGLTARAKAYGMLVHRLQDREKRIKELETALNKHKVSIPGRGAAAAGSASGHTKEPSSVEDAFERAFGKD
jgi:BMFP domain-containing protein YqiC